MTRHRLKLWLLAPLLLAAALIDNTPTVTQRQPLQQLPLPMSSASPITPVVRATPTHATRRRAAGTPSVRRRVVTLEVTAYTWTGNRTASGVWPAKGQAASNQFPFGTQLRVPGIGVVTVTDRIGAHSELDIYMTSEGACRRFGRRTLRVEVLDGR